MIVALAKLPNGEKEPITVPIAFVVDAKGTASQCQASDGDKNAALARVACEQFVAGTTITPAQTPAGQAVESVQQATVAFVDDD